VLVRYDMQCDECSDIVEEVRESGDTMGTCRTCGGLTHWKPSVQVQPTFKPVYHEHLDRKPVLLTSRRQYREELKKRDLRGPYWHGDNISEL